MPRHRAWRGLLVLAVLGGAVALVLTRPPRLGLDLRGGTQIVLEARDSPDRRADDDAVERTLEVLRRRVDQLGVAEPNLQRTGPRRIIVELPGVSDPEEALAVIGRTAQLAFRPVLGTEQGPSREDLPRPSEGQGEIVRDHQGLGLRVGPPQLTGEAVRDARAVLDPSTGGWHVQVSFRSRGAEEWARMTAEAACAALGDPTRRIAIVLDQEVISSPQVSEEIQCNEGITGGDTVITGDFTEREAKDLALLIRAGALPVPVEVVERRTIGPTLGEAAIDASKEAALIGAALTVVYMLAYYRLLGGLAALGLLAYGVVSFAVLLALNATLTLPGIAGFVLAVGMAVDANVLVFERIKEEHAAGRKLTTAVAEGFRRAWSAIADSNVTTLLAALLLFWLASGPVRGFGVTLSIGVAVSMFTALIVVRALTDLVATSSWLTSRPVLLGVGVGGRLRTRLAERNPNLMGRYRLWFTISLLAVALASVGVTARGLRYGVEFTGGRLLEFSTPRSPDVGAIRSALAERGFPRAVVQESGDENIVVRTPTLDEEGERRVVEALEAAAGPSQLLRDEFVGPTIGAELRSRAVLALGLALLVQLIYLAVRFRWNYGLAAVAAMFHDVVILVGVFAWLGKEIDAVFLAALLTVIGYSINDSVVVFDRIREQRLLRPKDSLGVIANDACLQTVPRTINTGLGAVFILVALYFLGGETLTDFALALLIGILVGTYSSVFTAAPLLVAIDRIRPAPVPTRPVRSSRGRATSPARARRSRRTREVRR